MPIAPSWGQVSHNGALSIATSLSASNMGVKGSTLAASGKTQGKVAVEKKAPAKNIMGNATRLPKADAAAGLRAQADRINPMFRNTTVPSNAITNIQPTLPWMLAPKAKTPTARKIAT